jgi:mono/diheme cytochrome c family protein
MNRFLKGAITAGSGLLLVAILIGALIPVATAGGFPQRKTVRRLQVDELFNQNCARCHGAEGRGDTPSGHLFKSPDFTDAEWWLKNSSLTNTKTLRTVVARGKGAMPAFGKKLSRSEISRLVDRVRKFRKPERKS